MVSLSIPRCVEAVGVPGGVGLPGGPPGRCYDHLGVQRPGDWQRTLRFAPRGAEDFSEDLDGTLISWDLDYNILENYISL